MELNAHILDQLGFKSYAQWKAITISSPKAHEYFILGFMETNIKHFIKPQRPFHKSD